MKKKVLVLFGGKSSEYEVSLVSANALLSNIDKEKYDVIKAGITKDGKWFLFEGTNEEIKSGEWVNKSCRYPLTFSLDNGEAKLICEKEGGKEEICPDVVFPMLHGKYGEDGQIQGVFSLMGIPLVGCAHASSAVCMDKAFTKSIVNDTEIRQAKAVVIRQGDDIAAALEKAKKEFGFPMFIKPACAGSSVGISKCKTEEDFEKNVISALAEDKKVLVEEFIKGREIEVAVMEVNGEYTVSVPAEIDLGGSEFYDYDTKYVSDNSSYYIPARIPGEKADTVRRYAEKIFRFLDCRGFSRVDFFYTEDGDFVFNEINTIPGFTPISMYPKLMMNEGMSFDVIIDRLISSAACGK